MKTRGFHTRYFQPAVYMASAILALLWPPAPRAVAQNPQLQERLAEVKQAADLNKLALLQYTWQEQQTVSIKGNVKKQELFQVQMGPDGKPQKTQVKTGDDSSSDVGRQHGLKHRIKEKKTEEFEDYAKQIAALAQGYAQPDSAKLQQLYQQGFVMIGSAGAPDEVRLVIQNYVKQADSVTIVFNRAQKAIQNLQVSSYLSDPSDAVKIAVQFAQLPDGTNHVSNVLVNGVSKQLTVEMQNLNYQKM
jgi:hypothetical protein